MYTGLVHLHNLLRWIILILLLVNILRNAMAMSQSFTKGDQRLGLFLLISSHIMLLLGLYQWFAGPYGMQAIENNGMSQLMQNKAGRYWAVEHLTGMLIAIVLITVGYSTSKRAATDRARHRKALLFYTLALLLILLMMPWPGREAVGRALFPGM